MLRKKLLIVLAVLVSLMLGSALTSVVLMSNMLRDLEQSGHTALIGTTIASQIGTTLTRLEGEVSGVGPTEGADHDGLTHTLESLIEQIERFDEQYGAEPDDETMQRIRRDSVSLKQQIMAVSQSPPEAFGDRVAASLDSVRQLRTDLLEFAQVALSDIKRDQQAATSRFRRMAIGLSIGYVLLINVSIVVLLRAAILVLRPVDRLVEASRALAREDYGHRIEIRRKDEFDELAQAFNAMAQHLQTNEERKVETLHQVARTLNHELNNAIAIIELQLRLVTKSPGYDRTTGEQLRLIHEALSRMNETIVSLKGVRRVVLTEYIEGVKMLDIKRSTECETARPGAADASSTVPRS